MSRQIRVDAEVFAELQRRAVEYGMQFATPNNVLRRLLEVTPPPPPDQDDADAQRDCGDAAEWDSDGVRS